MPLSKLNIRGSSAVQTPSGVFIFPVKNTHTLIQAAGYLKHVRGCGSQELVYFRGESKIYPSLSPTAFRGKSNHDAISKAIVRIKNSIEKFERPLSPVKPYAREALLQHYGLKTTWIDVVDNIWVALWFACHKANAVGPSGEYLHFERRVPRTDDSKKAYILLVAADAAAARANEPGLYVGANTELVDLRIAAPSIFVRPHAQHGLLMRKRGGKVQRPHDYRDQIRGVLEIDLEDALEWLGDSKALDDHSLFPPPLYDNGYKTLLDTNFIGSRDVGCIFHIGA